VFKINSLMMNKLVKIFIHLILPALLFFTCSDYISANIKEPPEIRGEAATLIDATTGTVIMEKNSDKRMYPASITKIVTGILALESSNLSDVVKVSKEARNEEGTRVYLAEGEEVSMEKLLYGLLVNSGNDAATAIAEHIDGTKTEFANRMNAFIKNKLNLQQTHFTNPHGLPDSNHYTTASDMAKIARYAMKNEKFREIVSTRNKPWVGKEWDSELVNHNKLLWSYEGANGIKNGYTNAAGFTLVSSVRRGNTELIGVILKSSSSDEMYTDMTALLDYGFDHVESKKVLNAGETKKFVINDSELTFYSDKEIWLTAEKGVAPEFTLDASGDLFVQNSRFYKPDQPIAVLFPAILKMSPNLSELDLPEPATDVQTISASDRKSPWEITLTIVWFLQLVFMVVVMEAKRRARKQIKS